MTAVFFFQLKATAVPIFFFQGLCAYRQMDKTLLPFLYVWSAFFQGKDSGLVGGIQWYLDMQFPSWHTTISLHSIEKM